MKALTAFPWVTGALLLVPLVVQQQDGGALNVGLPRIHGGDEPHYLVVLHSLVEDGDLDVADDYRAQASGGHEAGKMFAGRPLDHHVMYFVGDERVDWHDAFMDPPADAPANWSPVPRPGAPEVPAVERSAHPVGLPLLLAPLLMPLRGTTLVEPAALSLSAVATLLAYLLFRVLLRHLGAEPLALEVTAALAFLATPAWPYARTLFCEPWLLLCTIGAWTAMRAWNRPAWSGVFMALAMLMKPPAAIVVLPLLWELWRTRRMRALASMVAPMIAAAVIIGGLHAHMFGAPWRAPQPWRLGNPLVGLPGLLVFPRKGIFVIAPVLAVAVMGWWRNRSTADRGMFAAFLLQLGFVASWWAWEGGWCYGPRLLVPVLPILAVGLAWMQAQHRERWLVYGLGGLSVVFQWVAVVRYWRAWDRHPLEVVFAFLLR